MKDTRGQFQPVLKCVLQKEYTNPSYEYRPVEEDFEVTDFFHSQQKNPPPVRTRYQWRMVSVALNYRLPFLYSSVLLNSITLKERILL